ncbi:MAG TPA: AtpZ/AtpI family protein [Candidatus Marinimicrobia bacterium]|jgi:F0F1-type ATP synthase assembly protein I|nr:AtpZ/AtpI family protein [Candidatus Neomarinimicrobiota bacterium]
MPDPKSRSGFDIGQSLTYFQKIVKESGPAASASYTLLASVLVFTLLGWYIDSSSGTKPMGILVGLGIGLITGFYHLAKTIWKHKN